MKTSSQRWNCVFRGIKAIAVAFTLSGISGLTSAADTTVFVDGRSGPWNINSNSSFAYGIPISGVPDQHIGPTVVTAASGLSFVAGQTLIFQYVSGRVLAGFSAGAPLYGDGGNGIANTSYPLPCSIPVPGCYTGITTYLGQLIGTYANATGSIVGSPFALGTGPVSIIVPTGATQLLLGINDGWYNDNGEGINVRITAVPEPNTFALLVAGLGLLVPMLRSRM